MQKACVVVLSDRERVRGDLIERLERSGAADDANLDRVEKYMNLWDLAAEYVRDRDERGLYVTVISRTGATLRLNPSAQELVKVLAQMDKLYAGIESAKPKAPLRTDAGDEL